MIRSHDANSNPARFACLAHIALACADEPLAFYGCVRYMNERHVALALVCAIAIMTVPLARAEALAQAPESRQSLDDAWWTGPLLASSPATLPQGHVLFEPYLYEAMLSGHYDSAGKRHPTAHENDFGSQSYILYGLVDSVTLGVIPRFGFKDPGHGSSSSGVGVGDVTLQATYRLTQFQDDGWLPAMSLVAAETLPVGKYDRLGNNPSNGFGGGAYTTALSIYSQYYFWMPNGRILRTRLDLTQSWSRDVDLHDVSVYGTPEGFRGRAMPGNSSVVDLAFEYSVTRNWVAALDVIYERDGSTRVLGRYPQPQDGGTEWIDVRTESGSSRSLAVAPAVEYNWSSNVGVIVGAKIVTSGRNTAAVVMPAAAINLVF